MFSACGLNIVFVGPLPPAPWGSAIVCGQVLPGLARLGHKVRAIAPITEEARHFRDTFALTHPYIGVDRFSVPYFGTMNQPEPADYRRLERQQIQDKLHTLIMNERPDVILIGREAYVFHVPDLARTHSIPCVMLVQGGASTRVLDGTYPQALAYQFLEDCHKVDLIVAVASHWAESLKTLGLDDVKAIANPVDLQQFSPRPKDQRLLQSLGLDESDIIVLHASNLQNVKRPFDVVSSAQRALEDNSDLVYVIVGDGELRKAMEVACRHGHISERFRFVGWVDHSHMPDYINLADIVVVPSEAEVQALLYLETQACARVLVASDIPAALEVITDAETGLLFREGNVEDLTAKTLLAAGDSQLRADIGHRARKRVRTHDLNHVVSLYDAILMEVAERRERLDT